MKINKVVRPFVLKPSWTKRGFSVFIHIKYDGERLSISGTEGPHPAGNCRGGCGQINASFDKNTGLLKENEYAGIKFAPGWNVHKWKLLLKYWDDWHLNDMHAGCQHQRDLGWTAQTHLEVPCPICGYQFGTAWLKTEVPQYVLEFLESLPDSDKTPAWV